MKLAEALKSVNAEPNNEFNSLFRHFPEGCEVILKSYNDRDIIFRENDSLVYVGILISGRYSCSWEISGRDDYVHVSKKLPAMLGDQAALAGLSHYTGTFRALGKCKVILVRLLDYWLWMEQDISLYKQSVAKHIRTLLQQCQTRRTTVVEQADIRVIKYLTWYCRMNGNMSGTDLSRPLTVRVTRDTMTESIGRISLRTINRILSQLESKQLISIVKGKVCIRPEQYRQLNKILEKNSETL